MLADALPSFVQSLSPAHSTFGSTLVALIPIVLLLVLLPVLRMSAWQAVIIGSVATIIAGERPPSPRANPLSKCTAPSASVERVAKVS